MCKNIWASFRSPFLIGMDMLLSEITTSKIIQQNTDGFPNTKKRQFAKKSVHPTNIKFTPFVKTHNLKVDSITNGSSGNQYNTDMQFNDVEFIDKGPVSFVGTDNQKYFIEPLVSSKTPVDISCSCDDFKFRFANLHYNNGSLLGDPPAPYVAKTKRPPVNPNKSLGSCKHVLALVDKLIQLRVLSRG